MFSFDIDKYLNRIGIDMAASDLHVTGESLCLLQKAHLYCVPYENFDIIDGNPLDHTTEALYNKIVERERGGIFTELNGLFGDLLRAIGFGVNEYLARILYTEDGSPLKQHRVLEVQARDGNYICDVGIGTESPRIPLKKEEGLVQNDGFAITSSKTSRFWVGSSGSARKCPNGKSFIRLRMRYSFQLIFCSLRFILKIPQDLR